MRDHQESTPSRAEIICSVPDWSKGSSQRPTLKATVFQYSIILTLSSQPPQFIDDVQRS